VSTPPLPPGATAPGTKAATRSAPPTGPESVRNDRAGPPSPRRSGRSLVRRASVARSSAPSRDPDRAQRGRWRSRRQPAVSVARWQEAPRSEPLFVAVVGALGVAAAGAMVDPHCDATTGPRRADKPRPDRSRPSRRRRRVRDRLCREGVVRRQRSARSLGRHSDRELVAGQQAKATPTTCAVSARCREVGGTPGVRVAPAEQVCRAAHLGAAGCFARHAAGSR
jgi:hypothetical protein